jgi:sugar/nucleoside kinase (ribokinase family)
MADRILCLGEALVDLICERPVASVAEADAFVPHFGGVVANVAVVAARAGASVALAGAAGEDEWGRWLRDRLLDAGVDVSLFSLVPERLTTVALVAVDHSGEARYHVYTGGAGSGVAPAFPDGLEDVVAGSSALFISSNTLVGPDERELTMSARAAALAAGRPVVFDPNLRLHRWRSAADAAASSVACARDALLVRCNRLEASLMTGEDDPERAAMSLVKAGARLVVITLGAGGAILRGELRADAASVPVSVISTIGAGDVLTGVLLARLAATGFYPAAVAAGLRDAVDAAARVCERWGAVD